MKLTSQMPSSTSLMPSFWPAVAETIPAADNAASSPRHILPNDLPTAIKHLSDQELDQLDAAVTAEQQRRGKKPRAAAKIVSKRMEAPSVPDYWQAECCSRRLQCWRYACKDCEAVRNFSVGCPESAKGIIAG
jgi:hypothetical protein